MRTIPVPVGEPGVRYLRASLREGSSLGRAVASRFIGMTAEVMVPGSPSKERLLKFDRGGLGPSVISTMGGWLKSCFNGGILVVELPLWRPEDVAFRADRFDTTVIGEEVYATCSIGEIPDKVEATIRSADLAYMYRALVFPRQVKSELAEHSADWQERLADTVMAVVVGAYDGEGIVLGRHEN